MQGWMDATSVPSELMPFLDCYCISPDSTIHTQSQLDNISIHWSYILPRPVGSVVKRQRHVDGHGFWVFLAFRLNFRSDEWERKMLKYQNALIIHEFGVHLKYLQRLPSHEKLRERIPSGVAEVLRIYLADCYNQTSSCMCVYYWPNKIHSSQRLFKKMICWWLKLSFIQLAIFQVGRCRCGSHCQAHKPKCPEVVLRCQLCGGMSVS